MSSNIEILLTGYAEELPYNSMRATGSCCLVQTGGSTILFDTMGPWQRDLLIEKLEKLGIHPDDVSHVVCSHSHADHIGNLNLFTNCRHQIVGTSVYKHEFFYMNFFKPLGSVSTFKMRSGKECDMKLFENYEIDSNVHVEPTPGHTLDCVTMIVKNCDKYGTVGLVGDLFERKEDLEDEKIWISAGSQDQDSQRLYREYIHSKVDYIVPGHGPIFKTVQ